MGKRGRRPALDDGKQREILAILSVGCSQSVAAQYVGCAASTIQRTAERNPKFAEKLGKAKSNAEVGLVKNIRNAAKKEQYWRAAAWALERGFPEKYARRGPDVITAEQLARVLAQFADMIVQQVPVDEYRKNIVKGVESLARSLGQISGGSCPEEAAKDLELSAAASPASSETEKLPGTAPRKRLSKKGMPMIRSSASPAGDRCRRAA